MQKKRLKRGRDPRSNKVSIFTSTYNSNPDLFIKVFKAVKAQTWRDWEWIIFDDSTEDLMWSLLTELEQEDRRLKIFTYERDGIDDRYVISPNRSNNSVGWTKALCCNKASGKFLVELDHDDFLNENALELIVKASQDYPNAGFFYSDGVECTEDFTDFTYYPDHWGQGKGAHYWYWESEYNRWGLASRYPNIDLTACSHIVGIPNHVRVWTKEAYDSIGGHDVDLPVADDYDLFLRTVAAGIEIVKIPVPLYKQTLHGNQTQNQRNKLIQELTDKLFETHFPALKKIFPHQDVYITKQFEYWEAGNFVNKTWQPVENKVSVIIPTYNRPTHLVKAIDSVLAQDYQGGIEIIVIGDNCPVIDRVMRDVYRNQNSIIWFNLEKNYGAGGAIPRNFALKNLATGSLITYLDDDNTIEPSHISDLVKTILQNDVDYAFTDMNMEGRILKCRQPRRYRIDTSSIMHRKELLDLHGYWKTREEAGYAHDWELVSRWQDHKSCATGKATLNYSLEFNDQNINGIFGAYNDQE